MLGYSGRIILLLFILFAVSDGLGPSTARAQLPSFLTGGGEEEADIDVEAASPPPPGISAPSEPEFDFEQSENEVQASIRKEAFEAALKGLLPLQPEEIRILLERYDRTQESVEVPIYPDPKPLTVVKTISLDPGSEPLRIKTAFGHVTTLNFLDITGAPWPVENITWSGDFDIAQSNGTDGGVNLMRITPNVEYSKGNISMNVVGMNTPIIMIIETSRDVVHYRFDAVVPEYGPLAETPLIDRGITLTAGRADVTSLLQGIAPAGSVRMNVSGVDGRTSAYLYNGTMYLRTPLNLLSPTWSSSMASADGTKVYEIQNTPVVLLSDRGRTVRARISDREVVIE